MEGKYTKFIIVSLIIAMASILVSCYRPGRPAAKEMNDYLDFATATNTKFLGKEEKPLQLDPSVQNSLMPKLSLPTLRRPPVERKFNVAAQSVPAADFFNSLVEGTDYNIVVSPDIKGDVTLHLKNVTIDQVLAATEAAYGYRFQKESYGYHVYPSTLETRIFSINYLGFTRTGNSYVSVSSGLISQHESSSTTVAGGAATSRTGLESVSTPSSSVQSRSISDFWRELHLSLETIVGKEEGHRVYVNPVAGMIVLRGDPDQLDQARAYLDNLNKVMSREVLIQAEIMRITLNKHYDAGIQWNLLNNSITSPDQIDIVNGSSTSTFLNAINPIFTARITTGNLTAVMKFLSTQGNLQVLSSPRITSMNNQKAIIKVGTDEYFVTDFSSTVSGSGSDAQATQDVDLKPFFSGISLGVTPMITNDGGVMMHIHPIISTVEDKEKRISVGGNDDRIPSALSNTDESDNVVYSKSGQIIVVSGLRENMTGENVASVPALGKLPVVGSLFRRTNQNARHQELVILLKPTIISDCVWVKELAKTSDDYRRAKESFHLGNFPSRFGYKEKL